MKKFLFLLTGLMCMLVSCGGGEDDNTDPTPTPKPNEPAASITMSTNIPSGGLAFDVNGGEKSVSFTTNKDWTVTVAATTGGATWCTASPASGSQGDATVKFSVKENTDYDDRSVSVTIKAGTATKTFTINQKGVDALLVTTKKYEVAQEGGEIEVEVQTNIDYEMEISETAKSWITEASTRALTTHKHTFMIAANEEVEKREGEIIFKSGDKVETVKVYQAGGPVLVLSKNEFNVNDAGETIAIEVKSNIDFGVQMPDVDWIVDEASTRGMSSHTLKYDILPNETYDAREAEILFYDKNSDLKETVKIVQAQKNAIIISQKNYEVKAEGETIEVKLSANVDFDVTMPDVDWITQVTTRGLTEHTLYYNIAENTSEDSRSAEIVFTNKESQLSETISIMQKAPLLASYVDGVATIVEAGTLSALIPKDERYTISKLKVVGPLNGDDISYLRYNADHTLTTLDLSEAMIVEGGDYYYYYDNPNHYTGYIFLYTSNDVIGDYMFKDCDTIETILLPNSVTSIGSRAFYNCDALTSVTIGNSVTSIKTSAFSDCAALASVTIGNSVTSIGSWAFSNCDALTSITIPNSVTSIKHSAFSYCAALASVTIGNSVTSIEDDAFSGCSSLTSVYISDISSWCKIDFMSYDSNPLYRGAKLYLNNNEVTDLVIPDDVVEIKNYAFYGYKALTSITIPNSVTSTGESAFYNCDALTSATINGSIGEGAFSNCDALFYLKIGNAITSIGEDAFSGCSALEIVNLLDLSAWCNIDFIDGSANPLSYDGVKLYLNGNEVTDLVISDDVVEIKKYAFYDCEALSSITIPNSVTSIGEYAFYECNALTSATINGSIGEYAFYKCNALTEVTIGNGVTSINGYAFGGCDILKIVNILDLSAWCNIDFSDSANPLSYDGVKLYLNGNEVTDLVIPDDVVEIKKYAFYGYEALTSIIIPNSVTSMGEYAFYNCDSLKIVNILNLSAWCNIDFENQFANPLSYDGVKLYLNGNEVTDLVIPDDVVEIKKYAFYGCDVLTSITIPNSVTSIGEEVFEQCNALTEVTIGNGLTSIGKAAFKDCNALKMINILDLSAWCNIDFENQFANPLSYDGVKLYLNGNEVTDLVIPDDVVEIKKYVFYNCKALTSITIPNSVTSIGEYAFYYCDASYFYCYAMSPPKINEYTFDSNRKATLYVPKGCLLSYWEAYKWGESFNQIIEME